MATHGDTLLAYDGSDGAKAAIEAATRLFPGRSAHVASVWQSVAAAPPASLIAVPAAARAGGLDAAARAFALLGLRVIKARRDPSARAHAGSLRAHPKRDAERTTAL